jgi:hypothetical protein
VRAGEEGEVRRAAHGGGGSATKYVADPVLERIKKKRRHEYM